jgi:hypothetical protein
LEEIRILAADFRDNFKFDIYEGHGTARPSRDGLWATCPRSASSGNHAEFHEDCYQKHSNHPHNDPYLRL